MPAIGLQISRQDYNVIQRIVSNVWGPGGTNPTTNLADPTYGYGQILASSQIGTGEQTITELQWDQLRSDINKAYTHQVGSVSTILDVAGSGTAGAANATRVTASQVYQPYLLAANDILANKNLFAGSQRPPSPVVVANGTQTTNTPWSQSVSQLVEVTFNSAAEARYFFNSGATINFRSSRDGGTTTPQNAAAQNNSWTTFLNSTVGTVAFGRAQFYALTSNGLDISAPPVFLFSAAAPYSNNFYRIKANANVASNVNGTATFISFLIEWIDSSVIPGIATDYIDGTLTSIISETKSVGVAIINSPLTYNIGALSPEGTAINLSPIFALTSSVNSVDEGGTVIFTLTSRNYPSGKSYQLEILGVTDSQLVGSTAGLKNIVTSGNDTLATVNYSVTIRADQTTNPGSSVTARVTVSSDNFQAGEVLEKTVVINDTSITPTPSVSITATTANSISGEAIAVSNPSTVTVTNTGSRVLNISNISINPGSDLSAVSADFTNTSGSPTFSATTLAVAQSKTFTVKFAGSIVGTQTAVVTVTSDGNDTEGGGPLPGSTKVANISVAVAAATFGIITSPSLAYTTSFASDNITPGTTAIQTIRVTNSTGNATVIMGNPAVTITNVEPLIPTITGSPNGLTIAPGAFREFQVSFTGLITPSTTSALISIDCGLAGTPTITATVTGTASLPGINLSATATSTPPTLINVTATRSFTITNNGSALLQVSSISIAGQNQFSIFSVSPTSMSVPVGATQSVTITGKRSRIGLDAGTVTITSNAPTPNNIRTVIFQMTSIGLTPSYFITTALYTGNDANIIAPVRRNSTIQSYVTGAEPNTVGYAYHQQAAGVITGVPAGTSAAQAFASKIEPRTTDNTGKLYFWFAGSLTEAWDVGVSKLFAYIPIGKLDNGTQQYYTAAITGDLYRMETFPNLTLSSSASSVDLSKIDLAPLPTVTFSISGGIQNAPFRYVINESSSGDGSTLPTTDLGVVGANGTWSAATSIGAGTNVRTISQTYKGIVYKSNPVTVTGFSPAYFATAYPFPGGLDTDACWENANQIVQGDIVFRYYRSFAATPGVTYTVRTMADDNIWLVINFPQFSLEGRLSAIATGTFVQPAGRSTAYISWTTRNSSQFGSTWDLNPGAFSIQVFSGSTKVWGTRSSLARGF